VILRSGLLSHAQERIWLAKNYVEDPSTYNVAFAWSLEGRLNIPKFKTSVQDVAQRHESLRTRFTVDPVTGEPSQSVQESDNILFEVKNVEKLDIHAEFLKLRSYVFSLEDGQTMKIMVLQISPMFQVFMLCYHHIIMDGVSLRNFLMDLDKACSSAVPLKPVTGQYLDYALKQKDLIDSGSLSQDVLY
jgi:hybrid polyketide synthase / nonribosomal peptide synthetase ACE1